MIKKFFIYISFFVPIFLASCDLDGEPDQREDKEVKIIEVFPDSVRQYMIEQDSLKRGLISMIDTLTAEMNASKKEIEQLQTEIKEIKSPGGVMAILAFCSLLFSISAILMSVIRTRKKVDRWEFKELTRQMVKEHLKELEFRMNRAENDIRGKGNGLSSSSHATSTKDSIDKQLQDIYSRLSKIENNNNVVTSNSPSYDYYTSKESAIAKEPDFLRTGYAKVNSSKYFVEIFNSQQEDCVYKIKFINKEEGEFDIISLSKIKTINDLKEVLELASGSCLLNEATTYTVIEKGRCKKIDDNTWEVTKKLVIKANK